MQHMKKEILYIGLLCGFLLGFSACGDFLEEHSQNMAYVKSVTDLDEILIGEGYWPSNVNMYLDTTYDDVITGWGQVTANMKTFFPYIHLMDDDVSEYLYGNGGGNSEKNYPRLKAAHVHHWQSDPFLNAENVEIKDENWSTVWRRIAAMNSVIYQLDLVRKQGDDPQICNRVEGEARFLRAQYYFFLANLYGRPYCKATATTDLCIPLKTSEDIYMDYFARATSSAVYGQMVEDLQRATVLLRGTEQTTKYRTNQTAAFILLSRVHLFMENYEAAIACADSALANREYRLRDLNEYTGGSAVYVNSPEVVFTHSQNMMAVLHGPVYARGKYASSFTSSDDLIRSFDGKDLRLKAFFMQRSALGDGYRCVKTRLIDEGVSDILAIRIPEAYLNKAEAQALLGLDAEAINTVNELRSKRFATENLSAITENGEALVNFIRDERRRELCYEGHRWFDLRRYAVNSVHPFEKEIRHVSYAYTEGSNEVYSAGTYVLKPYSQDMAAYILPIPKYAIEYNEGLLTNEIRPEREMIVE